MIWGYQNFNLKNFFLFHVTSLTGRDSFSEGKLPSIDFRDPSLLYFTQFERNHNKRHKNMSLCLPASFTRLQRRPSTGYTLVCVAMEWLFFLCLLRNVTKSDSHEEALSSGEFDAFLIRSHLLEVLMLMHLLVASSYRWTWFTLFHLLRIHVTFTMAWMFVLWCLTAGTLYATSGTPLHQSSSMHVFLKDLLVASILSMVVIKATANRVLIHFSRTAESNLLIQNQRQKTTTNKSSVVSILDHTIFNTLSVSVLPEASVSFLLIGLFSTVYLLDWHERWQLWPIPTVISGIMCSTLEELLAIFFG